MQKKKKVLWNVDRQTTILVYIRAGTVLGDNGSSGTIAKCHRSVVHQMMVYAG